MLILHYQYFCVFTKWLYSFLPIMLNHVDDNTNTMFVNF